MARHRLLFTALLALLVVGVTPAWAAPLGADEVAQIAAVRSLPKPTTAVIPRGQLDKTVALLKSGKDAKAVWSAFCKGYFNAKTKGDVRGLVHWVVRASYLEPRPGLYLVARKAAFQRDRQAAVQRHVSTLQGHLAQLKTKGQSVKIPVIKLAATHQIDQPAAQLAGHMLVDKQQLVGHIDHWSKTLKTAGEGAALARANLQTALQSQAKLVQAMEGSSTMLHDTAMAVIRKLGG